jgi:GNAT superfamily N-acetyltransferase
MTCSSRDLRLGPSFERRVPLDDGHDLCLRWIRPSDAALLREGFSRLSPESRRMRFFGALSELPDPMLHYLTEVDGCDHAALIAVSPADERAGVPERGFGVARFVRSKTDATSAELAIVVTDDVQGHGLGDQLIAALAAGALERGIETFTVSVLWNNARVRTALRRLHAQARGSGGSSTVEYAMPTSLLADHGLHAV